MIADDLSVAVDKAILRMVVKMPALLLKSSWERLVVRVQKCRILAPRMIERAQLRAATTPRFCSKRWKTILSSSNDIAKSRT